MTSPVARDRVVAVLLFAAAEIEVLRTDQDGAPLAALMLAAAGYTLPFAVRRERTLTAVSIFIASVLAESALLTDATRYFVPFLGAVLFSYSAGAYLEGRRAHLGLAIMVVGILAVTLLSPSQIVGDYIFPTSFGAIAWLAGRAVRTRTRLTEELHEAAVREQEAHELQALRAAADERRRIAREMHDVVAHSVSVMVVQAGGARRILDRDPERAVAAAAQIERTGREALAEMRRLLGVIHREDDDEHDARAPQPTMAGVGALVARAKEAGLPVELYVDGERRTLPAGLDLAAFRVVQEGLTNALKYADRAPTEVHVRWGERELELEVLDRGPGPARERMGEDGHGLVGMRERVRLYGGELEAGRRRGGGFRIRAKLPLVADEATVEAVA
jgi:signal transduction histidine kinase